MLPGLRYRHGIEYEGAEERAVIACRREQLSFAAPSCEMGIRIRTPPGIETEGKSIAATVCQDSRG